jgi:inositol phosphorylceramide mannosyltransferase catalytic subunit
VSRWELILPAFELGKCIPTTIHQTYPTSELPVPLQTNVDILKAANAGWEHTLYTDPDIERFIRKTYGAAILASYLRLNPEYGPARADLFRYLLIYRLGGVYLDIKSTFDRPISEAVAGDEMFILSQWRNGPDGAHPHFGLYRELAHIPGGEFQQWHIIAAPGHPFLRAAIIRVLDNIDRYQPWKLGVGRIGVLRTTGPIPYTLAIDGTDAPHRRIAHESEIGLVYSIGGGYEHGRVFKRHYSTLDSCVVEPAVWARPAAWAFVAAYRLRNRWRAAARNSRRGPAPS